VRLLKKVRGIVHKLTRRIPFSRVERAYNKVRRELAEVGLLEDGRYLDRVECVQDNIPTLSDELGFVFDEGVSWPHRWVGYRPGVIYIPYNCPAQAFVPGGTLLDTLRHEFAHAWAWQDPKFFRRPWFAEAFGNGYFDEWDETPVFDASAFVSEYACTRPREDFAETFMLFLRARRSLSRHRSKRGLYAKLRAVQRAVDEASRTRVRRCRPRST
jgi:hypothetical protein